MKDLNENLENENLDNSEEDSDNVITEKLINENGNETKIVDTEENSKETSEGDGIGMDGD